MDFLLDVPESRVDHPLLIALGDAGLLTKLLACFKQESSPSLQTCRFFRRIVVGKNADREVADLEATVPVKVVVGLPK